MNDETYREAARQFREQADRLDEKADRERENEVFRAWFKDIHRGAFPERMAAMRLHPGRAAGDWSDLLHTLRELNIEFEIDRYRAAGESLKTAIKMVAEKANLSPDRIEKIYKKQRKGGRKSA